NMKIYFNTTSLFIILLVTLFSLTACSQTNESSNHNNSKNEASKDDQTITVDSEMGKVDIPTHPKNILAPFHEDTLLALGITPAAKWAINEQPQQYLEDELKDVPTIEWDVPKEQALKMDPDLII